MLGVHYRDDLYIRCGCQVLSQYLGGTMDRAWRLRTAQTALQVASYHTVRSGLPEFGIDSQHSVVSNDQMVNIRCQFHRQFESMKHHGLGSQRVNHLVSSLFSNSSY